VHQTATPGLAAAFDAERLVDPPAVPTTTGGLDFMPAGQPKCSIRRNDAHLLKGQLDKLAERYDVILVDGGSLPALPTEMLAEACDVTYLVIGLGQTDIDEARASVQRIREAGGQVLGCIALDAPRT
jgi:Mrp family chromosome partitioning ATPase